MFGHKQPKHIHVSKCILLVSHDNFGTILIWFAILHKDDVLLEEHGGCVHHPDEESVNVILEVRDLLALALHSCLEPD